MIGQVGRAANDQYLWAVVGDLATNLPAAGETAKALAGIKRTSSTIKTLAGKVANIPETDPQSRLFDVGVGKE